MRIQNAIPPATLAAAAVLLQQHVPDLSPTALFDALCSYGKPAVPDRRVLLSVAEFARAVGKSPHGVKLLCQRGKLPAVKVGSVWRIPASYLDALASGAATQAEG